MRKVPISAKKWTARMDEPAAETLTRHVATPSDLGSSSIEKLESATADSPDIEEHAERKINDWIASTSNAVPPQIPPHVAFTRDGYEVPLYGQPANSVDKDITDEKDLRAIAAAALKECEKGSGIIPQDSFPPTE